MHAVGHLGLSLAVLGSSGCAQIFGLDETSPIPDPGTTFKLTRHAIGATIVDEPLDLSTSTGTFLVRDAVEPSGFRSVPATLLPPDVWQVDLEPGAEASLRYTLSPDPQIRHVVLTGKATSDSVSFLGRPTSEAAPATAQLTFMASSIAPAYVTTDTLEWYSVGGWSQRALAGAELPPNGAATWTSPAISYATATSLTGRPLERVTSQDAALVLRYTGQQLVGVMTATPFTMAEGNNPVTGTMTAVSRAQTAIFSVDTTTPGMRFGSLQPAFGAPQLAWQITAAPGASLGFNTGPRLHGAALMAGGGLVPTNVMYGNPFPEWPSALTVAASVSRTVATAGIPAVTLVSRLAHVLPPPSIDTTVDLPSCLPTIVSVQGATLLADGLTVTLDRTKAATVSFLTDRQISDLYTMTVHEVTTRGAAPVLVPRFTTKHRQPFWSIPGDVFEAGKMYSIRAGCVAGGLPGLTRGDLDVRQIPTASAFTDSPVFTVVAQ